MKKTIALLAALVALGSGSAAAAEFSAGPVVAVPLAADMELRGRDMELGVMYGARAEYGRFGLMVTHGSGSAEWMDRVLVSPAVPAVAPTYKDVTVLDRYEPSSYTRDSKSLISCVKPGKYEPEVVESHVESVVDDPGSAAVPAKHKDVRRSADVDITTAMVYGKLPITCGIDAVGGLGMNVVTVDDQTGVGLAAMLGIEARRDLGSGFTGSIGVAGDINQGVEGLDEWMSLKAVAGVARVF